MLNVHPTYPPPRGVKFISSLGITQIYSRFKIFKNFERQPGNEMPLYTEGNW